MKQNTTPTLEIEIDFPFVDIKRLEFIFKDEPKTYARTLIHKAFEVEFPVTETTEESFKLSLDFSTAETMKLTPGKVFMDTRIVLLDGTVPETEIVELEVKTTLFGEVYIDGDG